MGFVTFLSVCVSLSLIWLAFIFSVIGSGQIAYRASYIVFLMGLFLPLVVIAMAVAMMYLLMMQKKNQRLLKSWIALLRRGEICSTGRSEKLTPKIEQPPKAEPQKTIITISPDEPLSNIKDMRLPEDVELRFNK